MDVGEYLQTGLFESGPVLTRRQFFNLFGQKFVPSATVGASCILSASIGMAAGSQWPERASGLLLVAPGAELTDVVKTRANRVDSRIEGAESVPLRRKLWVVADAIGLVTGWTAMTYGAPLCYGAFFDGASSATNRTDSEEVVQAWLDGVAAEWSSSVDAGLLVGAEPPCESYESWQRIADQFLTLFERRPAFDQPPSAEEVPWPALIDLWRFEVYRLDLARRSDAADHA